MQRNPTERAFLPRLTTPGQGPDHDPRQFKSVVTEDARQSLARLRRIGGIDELQHMANVLQQCDMPLAASMLHRRAQELGRTLRQAQSSSREVRHA